MSDGADGADGLAWHYTDGRGLLSILASHTLWATASPFLNDQQEVALGGRRIRERSRELAAERDDAFFADLGERVSESTEDGTGPGPGHCYILSASRSGDSLAMWRLYGGAQESYAIGLDPTQPLVALASQELTIGGRDDGVYLRHQAWRPVAYDAAEQRDLVDRALARLPALGRLRDAMPEPSRDRPERGPDLTADQQALVVEVLDDLQQALLLIKHEGFADEREVRYSVVFVAGHDGEPGNQPGGQPGDQAPRQCGLEVEARLLSYRATGYGLAPYLRLTGLPPDGDPSPGPGAGLHHGQVPVTATPSPLPIRAVAVSPSPNGEEATRSLRQVLLAHGYDVPVRRSAIPFRG